MSHKALKVKLTPLSTTYIILHHLNNSRHALRQHAHIDITEAQMQQSYNWQNSLTLKAL